MKRNKFSLSNYKLFTCNLGELIPFSWFEVIPGDVIRMQSQALIRCQTLNRPPMHPVKVRIHHVFIPNRLIWDSSGGADTSFEAFITGGSDGTATPTHPYISLNATTVNEGDLLDYLGIPPANYTGTGLNISALAVRAYGLCFNELYRDQDLVTERTIDKTDGQDTTTTSTLASVAWEKDMFTTCRPWETKGTSITIPLAGSAPLSYGANEAVTGTGAPTFDGGGKTNNVLRTHSGVATIGSSTNFTSAADYAWNDPKLEVDLSGGTADLTSATGVSISDLLLAFGLQSFQEARAKYGSRYVEYLKYLGITPQDGRLNEPEYLGGGKQVIQFSEVLATDGANTGDIYGHGITALQSNRFIRHFTEHGIVMSFMSVVPKAIYASGVPRKFLRTTKEHYFNRELQFIGDQIVTNKEIYSEDSGPDLTFGYQPRYEEYRSEPSSIAGEFRTSEDEYHFARQFTSDPALNSTFVTCSPSEEPFATPATDHLLVMVNNSIQARRPISPEGRQKLSI